MKDKKVNGVLYLDRINFNRVLQRKVHKSNKSSGKITVPASLIGKEVLVVIPSKKSK